LRDEIDLDPSAPVPVVGGEEERLLITRLVGVLDEESAWRVRVRRAGTYRVLFRFVPLEKRGAAILGLEAARGERIEHTVELKKRAKSAAFELELERGAPRFTATLQQPGGRLDGDAGVWQIEFARAE